MMEADQHRFREHDEALANSMPRLLSLECSRLKRRVGDAGSKGHMRARHEGATGCRGPETLTRWHRAGWRLLWRYKSRPGRPPIPLELRRLIRRMAIENPLWGEERLTNELRLKLGLRVSPRTMRKYMPRRPPGQPRGDQRWATFLRNHAKAIIACDFFVAVTVTFQLLYVFVLIHHGSRRLVQFNVTAHPTAAWTLQQLREAIGIETASSRDTLTNPSSALG
jgi:hypothetical protein